MKKFKLVLIGIGLFICSILIVATNNKVNMPANKNAQVQESKMGACGLEFEWFPYPFGI